MEAKTTITGCYAVWCLIHDPRTIIMIMSAGSKMAKQIATWCIQIIHGMPMLECLRVDKSYPGARSSVEAYDVNYILKGNDKSPSICCMGITTNNQGYRAHLFIADDVESKENSDTEGKRQSLLSRTREFSSFVQEGRLVYLGTPQSEDSVYNTLYGRGFDLRVWPGRIPTPEEMSNYMVGTHCVLAPYVLNMIAGGAKRTGYGVLGNRGEPVDPIMQSDSKLIFQETDKGLADFDLQYMLNTRLSDAERFPLKLGNLMFYGLSKDAVPGRFLWGQSPDKRHPTPPGLYTTDALYLPVKVSEEFFEYTGKYISLDPSGGGNNGDETGYAVLYVCNGYIFVMEAGGFRGGFEESEMNKIAQKIKEWDCHTAIIEKNYGNGALGSALTTLFNRLDEQGNGVGCDIADVWSSGQKEKRIVKDIEPILGMHRLVVNSSCIAHDFNTTKQYPNADQASYSWLYQLARLTLEKDSLRHDDRLEAISQGCGYLHTKIRVDAQRAEAAKVHEKHMQFITDPMGIFARANIRRYTSDGKPIAQTRPGGQGNVMDRFKHKRR